VVTAFKKAYPKVHLVLHQASPEELVRLLQSGEADIGIATEAVAEVPELVSFHYGWYHSVIAPPHHPLPSSSCHWKPWPNTHRHLSPGLYRAGQIDRAFAHAGLVPDIVMSALDADVIKTYVELELAVGIVASMAVDRNATSRWRW
jgi:LysR family cys regulon transcriptional activator